MGVFFGGPLNGQRFPPGSVPPSGLPATVTVQAAGSYPVVEKQVGNTTQRFLVEWTGCASNPFTYTLNGGNYTSPYQVDGFDPGAPAIVCTTTVPPTAYNQIPYSSTLGATGGDGGPYTYSGTPPFGLALSSSGVVSGTTIAEGSTASFSVVISDGSGNSATNTVYITATDATPITSFFPIGPPATVGVYFASGAIQVSGGTAPYTISLDVSSPPLPPGLLFSENEIAGTPTVTGGNDLFIKSTDVNGRSGIIQYTIVVNAERVTTIANLKRANQITAAGLVTGALVTPPAATGAARFSIIQDYLVTLASPTVTTTIEYTTNAGSSWTDSGLSLVGNASGSFARDSHMNGFRYKTTVTGVLAGADIVINAIGIN